MKRRTEEETVIKPFPWFEGYLVNMNKVYTELTLEKVEMGLSVKGKQRRKLKGYQEMFHCKESRPKNRKVLMKADPGMGKTTLGKKVTWGLGHRGLQRFFNHLLRGSEAY